MRHLPRYAALSAIGAVVLLALVVLLAPRPSPETAVQPTVTPSATVTPIAAATTAAAASAPASPASSDAAAMLRAHNDLRAAIGAPLVRSDERVTAAAQRHAEYLVRNAAGGHEETPGQPGFTGASVRDRLAAQDYDARTASEVAISVGPGTDGVRSLWVLPYHRLGLMHPHSVVAGWGYFESADRRATVGVMVYDFGAPAPDLLRSPAEGQRVGGTWDGQEFPDVLPAGAATPVGHPVMLMADQARTVELRIARITGPAGEVPYHVVPQLYERDYVAIVPARPLDPGTRYRVRLELTIAGVDVVAEWEFETER
jgi:uncharacterized protein YkwD